MSETTIRHDVQGTEILVGDVLIHWDGRTVVAIDHKRHALGAKYVAVTFDRPAPGGKTRRADFWEGYLYSVERVDVPACPGCKNPRDLCVCDELETATEADQLDADFSSPRNL